MDYEGLSYLFFAQIADEMEWVVICSMIDTTRWGDNSLLKEDV